MVARTHFLSFFAGEGGTAQGRSRTEQIGIIPTDALLLGFDAQVLFRFFSRFAGLVGHAVLRRIVRKPELTRPTIPRFSRFCRILGG